MLTHNSLLHIARFPQAAEFNGRIMESYSKLREQDLLRRSHFIGGRYENLYLDHDRIPELKQILTYATSCAALLLEKSVPSLKGGFWLNAMTPGQTTSKHDHDEDDELLSSVYYIHVPENSGNLIVHDRHCKTELIPEAGMLVLFSPAVVHSVSTNLSGENRLSMAMNFGPA